ncbi:uncharacterized protein TRAVEDRAFT_53502 [Trametes versicolor FP-101664 SS1]|uniref:uncharacterized protein n=1 Tax=Trametes versicolor (strain FP-101664) TaxID=717944 RepID=UPI00046241C9|nr:uncharacterized protein TRAVEDRAFT_53502 [Trametes versicolor FP-101664 SS1]EIW53087.1 hypothetical protein TRAVEDRAFT_53502 [Trametes versicolor FP-101664 SS1]
MTLEVEEAGGRRIIANAGRTFTRWEDWLIAGEKGILLGVEKVDIGSPSDVVDDFGASRWLKHLGA